MSSDPGPVSKNAQKKKRKRLNAKEKEKEHNDDEPVALTPSAAASSSVPVPIPKTENKKELKPAEQTKQKPLVERRAPKTRKTKVDDMLTEPQGPSYARVLKVQDPSQKSSMPVPSHLIEETPIVDKAPAPEEGHMQEPGKQKEPEWEQVTSKPKSISIREPHVMLFMVSN